jgi:hypothetical protein
MMRLWYEKTITGFARAKSAKASSITPERSSSEVISTSSRTTGRSPPREHLVTAQQDYRPPECRRSMRQQALYMQHRTGHIALGQCDPRPTGRRVVLQLGHQSAVLGLGALEGCWQEFAG